MASNMTPTELKELLRRGDSIKRDSFKILKTIAALLADPKTIPLGQEMLLRSLEHREAFGGAIELLEALVRSVGLFPYLSLNSLSLRDAIAYEYHRPENMGEDFVFHKEQAEVFRRLMSGSSVILSAPTSFGKSKIIDAVLASATHNNIAVIVPTLALIDETRRRLSSFSSQYKIITHVTQDPGEKNIFVFTAERAVAYDRFPPISFYVIDEFYKLDTTEEDSTRAIALNQAFYKLRRFGGQFYLLGPSVQSIPHGLQEAFRCYFYPTQYATVASNHIRVGGTGTDMERLVSLCKKLTEPTLIFCRSPRRVNEVAHELIAAGVGCATEGLEDAARWAANEYHPEWVYGKALLSGIGIHHGRLPRSLAQYVVRTFNEMRIQFLVCTSTLIEGVNTKAKNVVIFDNKIANSNIDFFTFNNIRGRSGRMFQHFVGNVYLFNDPPSERLPFVDFPLFTQSESAPDSLLIQMERDDLIPRSRERLQTYADQELLPIEVLRKNSSIEPEAQIKLARHIRESANQLSPKLAWREMPNATQLDLVCDLIWTFLVQVIRSKGGVFSARQLAFKVWQLLRVPQTSERIRQELRPGKFAAKSVDEAVERVLEFERTWASFELPRYMMAVSNIQFAVLGRLGLPTGDYSAFSSQVESLFHIPVLTALDEYGVPLQVALKLKDNLPTDSDLDSVLETLKRLDLNTLQLSTFEQDLVEDARSTL